MITLLYFAIIVHLILLLSDYTLLYLCLFFLNVPLMFISTS